MAKDVNHYASLVSIWGAYLDDASKEFDARHLIYQFSN